MNVTDLARKAYAPSQTSLHTARSIEAQLIAEITHRLSRQNASYAELVLAVHDNRQMWNVLAIDVADPDNGLPDALRAQIFYLAQFTNEHSKKFLKGEVDLSALIDVNTAILRGLRRQETTT